MRAEHGAATGSDGGDRADGTENSLRAGGDKAADQRTEQALVDSNEMPGQRGVSDTVTGVTATVRACHPLEGLRTGHWLESQTFPEVEYVVPNLIPEGFTLLVGAPKAGKSWLVLAVGISVAAGGKVLDQAVAARPVLHLALEDSDRRLRFRAKTLYPAGELPPDWPEVDAREVAQRQWLRDLADTAGGAR